MRAIGSSIHEAIDWTQDRLATTRPLAERTLFTMLAEKRITETESGFVLAEDSDEDEAKNIHKRLKSRFSMQHRPRSHEMHKHVSKMRARLRQNVTLQPKDDDDDPKESTDALS